MASSVRRYIDSSTQTETRSSLNGSPQTVDNAANLPSYALACPEQFFRPWERRWTCTAKLDDGTATTYTLWLRKDPHMSRTDHGYSYSNNATVPEFYLTCTHETRQECRDLDHWIQSALKTFLKYRKSVSGQCSLPQFIRAMTPRNTMRMSDREFTIKRGTVLDGIEHFSSEPPKDAHRGGLIDRIRFTRKEISFGASVNIHNDRCDCAAMGSYS
ncbi:hypothetical protein K461DRAFT_8910 [Myriangium duriaei CBS 260.36]|uniref:Uncharacterized protein n=1 Tax=Myriangium duriaei CBS 260.36 TaxID=1168546 RepID=A0A9P4MP88_9PEZI|nr:hypothetical protein K461DRAFT_8910 [Myriangium duriaei CBS 260.36]